MGFKISENDRKLLRLIPVLSWILFLAISVSFLLKLDKLTLPLGNSFAGWVRVLELPQTPVDPIDPEYSGIEITPSITPTEDNAYAQKELEMIMPIYNAYIANRDYAKYKATYDPANKWLAVNHGIDPNPNYTMSGLTQYSEIAMVLNQLELSDEDGIFTNSVKNGVKNITKALMEEGKDSSGNVVGPYVSKDYSYSGNFYRRFFDGNITDGNVLPLRFDQINSTFVNERNGTNSPIPVEDIDTMNQYFIPGTLELRTLVYKDDRMWMYKCWSSKPNTRCSAVCDEGYTLSLSDHWKMLEGDWNVAGWTGEYTPPSSDVDSVSQVMIPGTKDLKGYILKGSTVWAFDCS